MTRHSRAVALAAALLYPGFVVTQVAAVEDTEPSFRIEEAELDLGTIVRTTSTSSAQSPLEAALWPSTTRSSRQVGRES